MRLWLRQRRNVAGRMLARLHHIQTQSFRFAYSRNSSIRATGMADKFNAKQPVDPDVYSARWEAMWAAGIGKGQVGAGPVYRYGCPSNVHVRIVSLDSGIPRRKMHGIRQGSGAPSVIPPCRGLSFPNGPSAMHLSEGTS